MEYTLTETDRTLKLTVQFSGIERISIVGHELRSTKIATEMFPIRIGDIVSPKGEPIPFCIHANTRDELSQYRTHLEELMPIVDRFVTSFHRQPLYLDGSPP